MILGDDDGAATIPARTAASATTRGAAHRNGFTNGASSRIPHRRKTSLDGDLAPRRTSSTNDAPSFKFSRRPATGASESEPPTAPSTTDLRTSNDFKRPLRTRPLPSSEDPSTTTIQEKAAYRSLSPAPLHARPTSPAPDAPLPATPITRSRPVSIAIQPASPLPFSNVLEQHFEGNWSRRPSVDSFVDPPLSASGGGESGREDGLEIFPSDPIFEALHVLKQTMRQAASIPLDPTPFRTGEGSAVRQDQLAALLPALRAMQNQMTSAAFLLDVVIRRVAGEEDEEEEDEAGAAAYLLDGSGSNASDSGIGEELKEKEDLKQEVEKEESEQESELERLEEEDEEPFPLLVRHLSISH